jgi:Bacteriocin-protection, YdeI or OmpD-Associated/Domain of unknown function (DUF1905)
LTYHQISPGEFFTIKYLENFQLTTVEGTFHRYNCCLLPFSAIIEIIGVNPFVLVPDKILAAIMQTHGKDKGPIPVRGTVNGKPYTQTLVRFRAVWRLYINLKMLKDSPKRVGESIELTIEHDPVERGIPVPPKLLAALDKTPKARKVFENLTPSRQKEIVRYIANLKSEEAIVRNTEKAIGFLMGKNRFVGRDHP